MASFAGGLRRSSVMANDYASVVLFLVLSAAMLGMHVANGDEETPAPVLFIFGDSTVDVGTNNFLRTTAKANFPYNGIDFPYSLPTGRFSNGFNVADQLARLFGYKRSPPPFLVLEQRQFSFKRNIPRGVNFASAGSGILKETGAKRWGEVIFFEKQVQQFALVRGNITETLGSEETSIFLSKALFIISVGSNDLFDFSRNDSGIQLGKDEYFAALQSNYSNHIRKLYELGARKFGVISLAPIGCCPAVRVGNGGECVSDLNLFAGLFHAATEKLLKSLSSELEGMKYSLGNSYAMTMTMFENPLVFGLKDTITACCGQGKLGGEGPCFESTETSLCRDRRDHLFWDWLHPTERASELAALTLYGGGTQFVAPISFSELAGNDVYKGNN